MSEVKRLLSVDLGNSYTKYGLFENGQLTRTWSHPTADAYSAAPAILTQTDAPIALSSVVPHASKVLETWCSANGRALLKLERNQSIITNISPELGVDLIAGAVAALRLYSQGSPIMVIGLGTATTLTAVAADAQFKGVYLTLGLGTSLEALAKACALLAPASGDLKEIGLGFTTQSSMRNGALLAHVGIVEAWIAKAREETGAGAVVVATGGWSAAVSQHTKTFNYLDPDLTLKGIFLLSKDHDFQKPVPPSQQS